MEFDFLDARQCGEIKIEYGVLKGGDKTVFIKAGRGGTYLGECEKYLRFAEFLRARYGVTVICSSNPCDCKSTAAEDISVLREHAPCFGQGGVYLWGTSDGAFKCMDIAERIKFEKAVLVNMPLMINFYKNKERLKKLEGARIAFVYGDSDPSFKYIPFLRTLEGCAFETLENAGHVLSCTQVEIELFSNLFFNAP